MLRLELSGTLQQVPPRMDMCSECAQLLEQVGSGAGGGWWRTAFGMRAVLNLRAAGWCSGECLQPAHSQPLAISHRCMSPPLLQLELTEGSCQACADVTLRRYQEWGMQKAVPTAAAVSSGAAAAAAADLRMGEQQQQQQCVGDSDAGGAEGGPVLPRQQPPQ